MTIEMTLDLDETIAQVQGISAGLIQHYPGWTEQQRVGLAAQLLQVSLQQECLRYLVSLDDKV